MTGEEFSGLVEKYAGTLFRMVLSVTLSREDAEDAMQEALFEAVAHR